MDLGIKGKTALVLAASSGLGAAIATTLAREGAKVAITGTNRAKLDGVAATIRSAGGTVLPLVWDLGDLGRIEPCTAEVENTLGLIDILINNTGGPPPSPAAGQPVEVWRKQFEAMILSVIATTDRILPGMKARGWGRIVTCTSMSVVAPIAGLGMSNTLRPALVGWSKTLAGEVAQYGITLNILAPGRIDTDRVKSIDAAKAQRESRSTDDVAAESRAAIPARRYGRADEFADAAAFLASDRASYITGSVIRVDGGAIPSL
jgi:3-oxoacyl-[acyl-carrier protein] reductase